MGLLDNVKRGDKLVVRNNYGEQLEIVVSVTKTLVCTDHHRFRKVDGHIPGNRYWEFVIASPAKEEDIARICADNKRKMLIHVCKTTNYDRLTTGNLERIVGIIREEK